MEELIADVEWQKYLEEEFSQVIYNLPKKDTVENFLRWRKKTRQRK